MTTARNSHGWRIAVDRGGGDNTLMRGGGRIDLPGRVTVAVRPGDVIEIETPGGGGFGTPTGP